MLYIFHRGYQKLTSQSEAADTERGDENEEERQTGLNTGETQRVEFGCGQKGKGEGHENQKPQACVGETRGAKEGVGKGGRHLPTSKAASL